MTISLLFDSIRDMEKGYSMDDYVGLGLVLLVSMLGSMIGTAAILWFIFSF